MMISLPNDVAAAVRLKLNFCFLLSAFLIFLSAQAAETNAPAPKPDTAHHSRTASPPELAAAYEQAGRQHEAAALYEAMVRTNTVARKVLAGRLVSIYIQTGETNQALVWAREVMRENPDPQAYLAAVHAKLGQFQLAEEILAREIAQNTNPTRAVTLRWQLAGVFERLGNHQKARKLLNETSTAAKGTRLEAAAQKRLQAFK